MVTLIVYLLHLRMKQHWGWRKCQTRFQPEMMIFLDQMPEETQAETLKKSYIHIFSIDFRFILRLTLEYKDILKLLINTCLIYIINICFNYTFKFALLHGNKMFASSYPASWLCFCYVHGFSYWYFICSKLTYQHYR